MSDTDRIRALEAALHKIRDGYKSGLTSGDLSRIAIEALSAAAPVEVPATVTPFGMRCTACERPYQTRKEADEGQLGGGGCWVRDPKCWEAYLSAHSQSVPVTVPATDRARLVGQLVEAAKEMARSGADNGATHDEWCADCDEVERIARQIATLDALAGGEREGK